MKINWTSIQIWSSFVAYVVLLGLAALSNGIMVICVAGLVMITLGSKLGMATGVWLMVVGYLTQLALAQRLRGFLFGVPKA